MMKSCDVYVVSFHHKQYVRQKMIKRDVYLQKIIDYMWDGQIKVITGIRRCGKSTLLFDLFYEYLLENNVSADCIIKIQLDKRQYAKYRNPIELAGYVEGLVSEKADKFYLFIDEVQFCHSVPDVDNPGYDITVYDMLNELKTPQAPDAQEAVDMAEALDSS